MAIDGKKIQIKDKENGKLYPVTRVEALEGTLTSSTLTKLGLGEIATKGINDYVKTKYNNESKDITIDWTNKIPSSEADYILASDSSGNVFKGTKRSDLVVGKASKLETGHSLTLSGDVSGTASLIDGSQDVSITVSVLDNSHNHTIANITNLETELNNKLNADDEAISAAKTKASLTFTGGVTGEFNGSVSKTVHIPKIEITQNPDETVDITIS